MAELGGSFTQTWLPCNIYLANSGCAHPDKDNKTCCATPVVDDGATAPRIVPWESMRAGDGICIPVDADKTDGKVTTTAFKWSTGSRKRYSDEWRDTKGATQPNPQKYLTIPSQSLELECSASSLVVATSAALALAALI